VDAEVFSSLLQATNSATAMANVKNLIMGVNVLQEK
jgi:hypothetical protein